MAITMSARRYHRLKDKIEAKLGDGAHRESKFSPDPSGNFYVCRQILGSTARNFISELLIRDYLVLLKKARKNRPFELVSDCSRKLMFCLASGGLLFGKNGVHIKRAQRQARGYGFCLHAIEGWHLEGCFGLYVVPNEFKTREEIKRFCSMVYDNYAKPRHDLICKHLL